MHSARLGECLNSQDPGVCAAACWAVAKLPPEQLAMHSARLGECLDSQDPLVCAPACRAVAKLPPEQLAMHSARLGECLDSRDPGVCAEACRAVAKLPPEQLAMHSAKLGEFLNSGHPLVCAPACRAVANLPPAHLATHSAALRLCLQADSESICEAACQTFAKFPDDQLTDVFPELLSCLERGCRNVVAVCRVLVQDLTCFPGPIPTLGDDTLLHVASRVGSKALCQELLQHGALLGQRNKAGETSQDLAEKSGHDDVASFLASQANMLAVRGGTGNAIGAALIDDRSVHSVDWYVIPLCGSVGFLGGKHSLLRITLASDGNARGDPDSGYVIEKAYSQPVFSTASQDAEIADYTKNGIYVSHWKDVRLSPSLSLLSHVPRIVRKNCQKQLLMRDLIALLNRRGAYDAGQNNCSHAAMQIYNECASSDSQLESLPLNRSLIFAARCFGKFGVRLDFSRSESNPLQGQVARSYQDAVRDDMLEGRVPSNWESNGNPFRRFGVASKDEYTAIQAYLFENGADGIPGFDLCGIYRYENHSMFEIYRSHLVHGKILGQRELWLFHGPGKRGYEAIIEKGEGFSDALPKHSFNAYGPGHYFALDLRLPDYFATGRDRHTGEMRRVLLCRVAVGKSAVKERIFPFVEGDPRSGRTEEEWRIENDKEEHRRPPAGHQSCLGESLNELVVYERTQVYPAYVIEYKSTALAGNPYGALRNQLKQVPLDFHDTRGHLSLEFQSRSVQS